MNGVQVMKQVLDNTHSWFKDTTADVSAEQANKVPTGTAHPISAIIAHTLHGEDGIINMLQGKPPVWESEGWGTRLGIPFVMMQDEAQARALKFDPKVLEDYQQKVYANTDAYLSSLKDSDLERELDLSAMNMGRMTVAGVLSFILIGNTFAHTGEIAALKGVQGLKGYPF